MNQSARIDVRVTPATKERWKAHGESCDWSLTELIGYAVEHLIAEMDNQVPSGRLLTSAAPGSPFS